MKAKEFISTLKTQKDSEMIVKGKYMNLGFQLLRQINHSKIIA